MKTQTYIDFKNFVKENCVIPYNDVKKTGHKEFHYNGDSAHLIYTAWYIFKHRLTGDAIEEYIKKDFNATKNHFNSNACYCNIHILKPDAKMRISSWGTKYYDDSQYIHHTKVEIWGGDWYRYGEQKWINGVMNFYNFWKEKLDAEIAQI